MKKIIKMLCLVLALTSVMTGLTACKFEIDIPSDSSSSPEETPIETEPPAEPITITADYVIVRPELCSDGVTAAAMDLKSAVTEALGASVSVKEDFLYGDLKPADLEILVGMTNREESARALETIKYNDYVVAIDGNKLVINAYNDEKIAEAVEYVKSILANGTTVTDADQKTVRDEYTFDTVTLGGLDLTPGGGHGNPLQYSYLENPMDRAWRATVHGVEKNRTQLK